MTEERCALLRKILDRRQAEVCAMRSALKKAKSSKRAALQKCVNDLQAALEVATEIFHEDRDSEERIKGLYLNFLPSEFMPPLEG